MDGALLGQVISHALFVASGITYSIYWVLQERSPGSLAVAMFFAAVLSGVAAAMGSFASTLAAAPETGFGRLKPRHVLFGCAAVAIGTYIATTTIGGRPFTSELPFAMIWAAAELSAILVAGRRGWLSRVASRLAVALASIAVAVCLGCYAIYFELAGQARFVAGLVPYGAVALAMTAVDAMLVRALRAGGGGLPE